MRIPFTKPRRARPAGVDETTFAMGLMGAALPGAEGIFALVESRSAMPTRTPPAS